MGAEETETLEGVEGGPGVSVPCRLDHRAPTLNGTVVYHTELTLRRGVRRIESSHTTLESSAASSAGAVSASPAWTARAKRAMAPLWRRT